MSATADRSAASTEDGSGAADGRTDEPAYDLGQRPSPGPPPAVSHGSPQVAEVTLTRAYLSILAHPRASGSTLVDDGVPAGEVADVVSSLSTRGLIGTGEEGTWTAVSPDATLRLLIAGLESQVRAWRASSGAVPQLVAATPDEAVRPNDGIGNGTDVAYGVPTAPAQSRYGCSARSRRWPTYPVS